MNWDDFETGLLFLLYVAALKGKPKTYKVTRYGKHPNPDYNSRLDAVRLELASRGWVL